ncbi:hypothetical protein MJD09_09980 [bacterium]|nr:hypothetical protein [bacterium]
MGSTLVEVASLCEIAYTTFRAGELLLGLYKGDVYPVAVEKSGVCMVPGFSHFMHF